MATTRDVVVSRRTLVVIVLSLAFAYGALMVGAYTFSRDRENTEQRFREQAQQIASLARSADRSARRADAQARGACRRSQRLTPLLTEFYRDQGASSDLVRLYLATAPRDC